MKTTLITDTQSLVSAKTQYGSDIKIYDDGFGPLFIHRDSMGISGIVRAQTWGGAYSICEDEFFPEANETVEEIETKYGFIRETYKVIRGSDGKEKKACASDYPLTEFQFVRWETKQTRCKDAWLENALFQEAFGFRPNGPNATDTLKHGIYAKDLNGDSLEILTPELLASLEITLEIVENE